MFQTKKIQLQRFPPYGFYTARYEHKSSPKKFLTWTKRAKKYFQRRLFDQDRPDRSSAKCLFRSGEVSSAQQTLIDQTNDCVTTSERGALVRSSDPPPVPCVYNIDGDTWRAPARRLIQNIWPMVCRKQTTKPLRPYPIKKTGPFFRFGTRTLGVAGNLSPPRPRIHLICLRPSSTFISLARHELGRGLILYQA